MALLSIENVSFRYDRITALEHVNFTVDAEDYLCVLGENGSGKSTLIKGLLGLKKPASGTIRFADGLHPAEIGYLPQQSGIQWDFPATVEEIVLSGTLNQSTSLFYSRKDKEKAYEALRMLNAEAFLKKGFRTLSGGQQQRVLLARALAAAGRILLLDEPVTGLDPDAAEEMYQVIHHLNKDRHMAIIMVSHDPRRALQDAKHVLVLDGRQKFYGTTEAYQPEVNHA